jgi:tetratricopeptide (TPR) repeat protein
VLIDRAEVSLAMGDEKAARKLLDAAMNTEEERKGEDLLCRERNLRGRLALADGNVHDALDHLEDAWDLAQRAKVAELERDTAYALGNIQNRVGATWMAGEIFEKALEIDERASRDLPQALARTYHSHVGLVAFRKQARAVRVKLAED